MDICIPFGHSPIPKESYVVRKFIVAYGVPRRGVLNYQSSSLRGKICRFRIAIDPAQLYLPPTLLYADHSY